MIDSGNGGLYYLKSLQRSDTDYILIMDKAFFPYGERSKEFLLKRSLYLCYVLKSQGAERIILACNTLSLIALPFLKLFFTEVSGVFQDFLPYLTKNSAILGSKKTIALLKTQYPDNLLIDGSRLISKIEHRLDTSEEVAEINRRIKGRENIILACTHFLGLSDNAFVIPQIKNKVK